jgi:hypothetical protein
MSKAKKPTTSPPRETSCLPTIRSLEIPVIVVARALREGGGWTLHLRYEAQSGSDLPDGQDLAFETGDVALGDGDAYQPGTLVFATVIPLVSGGMHPDSDGRMIWHETVITLRVTAIRPLPWLVARPEYLPQAMARWSDRASYLREHCAKEPAAAVVAERLDRLVAEAEVMLKELEPV